MNRDRSPLINCPKISTKENEKQPYFNNIIFSTIQLSHAQVLCTFEIDMLRVMTYIWELKTTKISQWTSDKVEECRAKTEIHATSACIYWVSSATNWIRRTGARPTKNAGSKSVDPFIHAIYTNNLSACGNHKIKKHAISTVRQTRSEVVHGSVSPNLGLWSWAPFSRLTWL